MDADEERQHILARKKSEAAEIDEGQELHVYKRRWWVMAVLALGCMLQASIWSTWGPVAESSEAVLGWTDGTIGQISALSGLCYTFSVIPLTSFMDAKGLRLSILICSSLILVCTVMRCFTLEPAIFTPLAHVASCLQGTAAPLSFSGPALFAAVWFPLEQRALATALVSFFNYMGETLTFLIGPLLVPSPIYATPENYNQSGLSIDTNSSDSFENVTTIMELNITRFEEQGEGTIINMEEMKQGIRNYMYLHAGLAALFFVSSVLYFPAKPPKPPSITASLPRTNYKEALQKVARNKQFWIIVLAGAFPRALFGSWLAVYDVVVKQLGVSQLDAGWMAFWHMLLACIAGIIFAKFSDFLGSRRKGLIISMSVAGVIIGVWVGLLCDGFLAFDMTSLYAACILMGFFVDGLIPLFYEVSAETAYPVGEGTACGFYTLVFCGSETIYFGILSIPNIGVRWMTWLCVAALFMSIPLMLVFKERNKRYDIDKMKRVDSK